MTKTYRFREIFARCMLSLTMAMTGVAVQALPNPASENCIKTGGRLEFHRLGDQGTMGICFLPKGRVCEEWVHFREGCLLGSGAALRASTARPGAEPEDAPGERGERIKAREAPEAAAAGASLSTWRTRSIYDLGVDPGVLRWGPSAW